ncbi:MAG TPA: hypothetical protein VFT45_10970 [Longimicrobium sp.]|nr:hypothetical protein [Longimicrobium sp.]
MIAHTPVPLDGLRNARAATRDADRHRGGVNAWGNSFPAEELPFGAALRVGGIPFVLPPVDGEHDHVETLGQAIRIPPASPSLGVALLCFGEMGDQALGVDLYGHGGEHLPLVARAKGWLVPRGEAPADAHVCSHLHYPGGYELDPLRPALWCSASRWEAPVAAALLRLGINPLFHLVAVTLLHAAPGAAEAPRAAHGG